MTNKASEHIVNHVLFTAIKNIFDQDQEIASFFVEFEVISGLREGDVRQFIGRSHDSKIIRCDESDKEMFLDKLNILRNEMLKFRTSPTSWSYYAVTKDTHIFWCAQKNPYEQVHLFKQQKDFCEFTKKQLREVLEQIDMLEMVIPNVF